MDDDKYIQLIVSPDAFRKIKQILIAKKMANNIDTLDNQLSLIHI